MVTSNSYVSPYQRVSGTPVGSSQQQISPALRHPGPKSAPKFRHHAALLSRLEPRRFVGAVFGDSVTKQLGLGGGSLDNHLIYV